MSAAEQLSPDAPRPLERLVGLIQRYVVMTEAQRLVVALWIVHAHCVEHFEQTPYLAITSPEKQCGKSRLLELLDLLVPRSWMTVLPSEAVVYRMIDAQRPTLLLDEVDTIFNLKSAERYDGLRAILNAGHRRGATVPRCIGIGAAIEPVEFQVYCAKVLAGIGTLPDTVADRSIPIRLQRKTPDERVDRFRRRDVEALATPIRDNLASWTADHAEQLAAARPDLPDELSDRMQDGCEPLFAIADALGYGDEARDALVELLTVERRDSTENAQVRLLRDLRNVFATHGNPNALTTTTLLSDLIADDETEWSNWYGKFLTSTGLAKLLKPYGIESTTVREGDVIAKGYRYADLYNAWSRYLPETDVTPVTATEAT